MKSFCDCSSVSPRLRQLVARLQPHTPYVFCKQIFAVEAKRAEASDVSQAATQFTRKNVSKYECFDSKIKWNELEFEKTLLLQRTTATSRFSIGCVARTFGCGPQRATGEGKLDAPCLAGSKEDSCSGDKKRADLH